MLSSLTVDGHQMYSGGSVVGKASTFGTEISPTHRRSQDFVWGVHFFPQKVDDLFLVVALSKTV